MQTVVYNAQFMYRAEILYFEHMYPSSVVQIVRQFMFWLQHHIDFYDEKIFNNIKWNKEKASLTNGEQLVCV